MEVWGPRLAVLVLKKGRETALCKEAWGRGRWVSLTLRTASHSLCQTSEQQKPVTVTTQESQDESIKGWKVT